MTAKEFLNDLYLDWFNNYLSIDCMAEHHEIDLGTMTILIELGKQLNKG